MRWRRRAGNFVTVVSLVLLVGTALLWVRGRRAQDMFCLSRSPDGRFLTAYCTGGLVQLDYAQLAEWEHMDEWFGEGRWRSWGFPNLGWASHYWRRGGFGVAARPSIYTGPWGRRVIGTERYVVIPLYLPLVVFACPPTLWLNRRRLALRRGRRVRAGLCADCGYDLRGTPERCPECGRGTTRSSA